jgi:hypothetical protein
VKTLLQIFETKSRAVEVKIIRHPGLANGKYAHVCNDCIYVSPAMHSLLTDSEANKEELRFIASHIFVVDVTIATCDVYDSEIERFLRDVKEMQEKEKREYETKVIAPGITEYIITPDNTPRHEPKSKRSNRAA